MGRGIAYPYEHFMLIDDCWTDGSDELWADFKDIVLSCLQGGAGIEEVNVLDHVRGRHEAIDRWGTYHEDCRDGYIAVGIDSSGDRPALYACWEWLGSGEDNDGNKLEAPERYGSVVVAMFNALIQELPGTFSASTSAWTARSLNSYP